MTSIYGPTPALFRAKGLNENYARELLELHTIGVDGGYTQEDVIQVAKCLTGWTIRSPQQGPDFYFQSLMHESGDKVVLGRTIGSGGVEEGEEVLTLLARGGDSALDLDGFFGFHPSLESLLPIYQKGELAVIHAAGSPHPSRSHFDAQDFMESGVPGDKSVSDGWLNRYLQHNPVAGASAFRGVSLGSALPLSLKGRASAIALGDLNHFDLRAGRHRDGARSVYESLYNQETNTLLSGTAKEMFGAIDFLRKMNPSQYRPSAAAQYPRGRLAQKLQQVAQMIKADMGVEVVFVDIGGWDHHVNEGGINGQLANLLRELSQSLAAFYRDLGDEMENVVVLTVSEFGRTVHENSNGGTDHGHANVMLTLGGPVKGGRVHGDWPGLDRGQLFEGRDLAVTTDFRDVFSELLVQHLGCRQVKGVFPGFSVDPGHFRNLI